MKYLNRLVHLFLLLSSLSLQMQGQETSLPSDSLFSRYLQEQKISIYPDNKITLISSGRQKFDLLFKDIYRSHNHIHMEYFNFRSDSIARELFTDLAMQTAKGVKVRTMFDAFGNLSNNRPLRKEHLKMLNERGIEIIEFDPIRFPWINHVFSRDHQKIVVLDGRIGYVGGMNVADYYVNGLPEIGPWRDMHVRLEGPVVGALQEAFLHTWNKETRQTISGDSLFPYHTGAIRPTHFDDGHRVAIVQRIPNETPAAIRKAYIAAIDAAQRHIQLINPYFTPTPSIRRAIHRALKRGVEVEIMIPAKSDISFTPDAGFYFANQLRKKGAKIYLFNGGFHHSKVMMIDHRFCTVGSANLNSRSLRFDYEINAFIFDKKITDDLIHIFREDERQSEVMTREWYHKDGAWKRFYRWFAHLLGPIL